LATAVKPVRKPPELVYPTPEQKRINVPMTYAVIIGPLIGVALAIWFGWNSWVKPWHVAFWLIGHFLISPGVTVGYHRLFTHGSFVANRPLKITLAVLGMLGLQGLVKRWTGDHMEHHVFSDTVHDLHSPMKSAFHAHVGWLIDGVHASDKYVPVRVKNDPDLRRIDELFPVFAWASFIAPIFIGAFIGWAIDDSDGIPTTPATTVAISGSWLGLRSASHGTTSTTGGRRWHATERHGGTTSPTPSSSSSSGSAGPQRSNTPIGKSSAQHKEVIQT
jgi:hypothetical protein